MDHIIKKFPISNEEYMLLERKFGNLAQYAAWQLVKKNSRNNHTDEQSDIAQELCFALITAGAYHKRQTYIESCLNLLNDHVTDELNQAIVEQLWNLWNNRKRHGANKQKYGPYQEKIMEDLVIKYVPKELIPDKNKPLKMDATFQNYCKSITWNRQRAMGKKITREKEIRGGQVSLSEFHHLG